MPEFYRLGMTKEEINDTLQTAVREPQPVVAGNFAAFTEDGQIIDSEKSAEDFAPAPLAKDLTLYVNSATGNDRNDGFSGATAKRTIQAAVNSLPKNLGTAKVTLEIAAGEYTEDVSIYGFYGGAKYAAASVQINGNQATINGRLLIYVNSCLIIVQDLVIHPSEDIGGLNVQSHSGKILLSGCTVNGPCKIGYSTYLSDVVCIGCDANHCTTAFKLSGGMMTVSVASGTGNTVGYQCDDANTNRGGFLQVSYDSLEVTGSKYIRQSSGVIFENGRIVEV